MSSKRYFCYIVLRFGVEKDTCFGKKERKKERKKESRSLFLLLLLLLSSLRVVSQSVWKFATSVKVDFFAPRGAKSRRERRRYRLKKKSQNRPFFFSFFFWGECIFRVSNFLMIVIRGKKKKKKHPHFGTTQLERDKRERAPKNQHTSSFTTRFRRLMSAGLPYGLQAMLKVRSSMRSFWRLLVI